MSTIDTLITNIKSEVANALGSSYSEMPYTYEIGKNSFKSAAKKYAVLPGTAVGTEGVNQFYTVNQEFIIHLADRFTSNKTGDSSKQAKVIALQDLAHAVYQEIYNSKAGSTSIVMRVNHDIIIEEPTILSDDNVAVVTLRFTLRYRKPISVCP